MSFKIHLLKKAIIELQEAVDEFKKEGLSGKFVITINFFKGGITGKQITKELTEK